MTARYWSAQFEWAAHVRLAQQAGLGQEAIDAIAERRTPHFSDPGDQIVYDFCRDYYDDHRVDQATYERVVERFGHAGAVDLAGLIGYYSFVSVTLNVFEVPPPPGAKLLEE
jgi:4-carboxymuconolactone decarboxylase